MLSRTAIVALACLVLAVGRSDAWYWGHCEWWGTCEDNSEMVLASNCSDIIDTETTVLARVDEELTSEYFTLVTNLKDSLSADNQEDYPMRADAELYKAIECFENVIDDVSDLEDASNSERTKNRLERALRQLTDSLADLYTAVNDVADASVSSAVVDELDNMVASLSDALDARNALFACFDMGDDDDGGATDGGNEGQIP